jgi:general secretion pathway protein K
VKVTDLERRVNINRLVLEADPPTRQQVLEQAFRLIGADTGEFTSLANSIIDWIDYDNNPGTGGAENETYQGRSPAYFARNRPIDDLSDLLLVKGITYEMYAGGEVSKFQSAAFQARQRTYGNNAGMITYPVGLTNLFTCFGSGAQKPVNINLNTAPSEVLQLIPGVDENLAGAIIERRNQAPFVSMADVDVPGMNQQIRQQLTRFGGVQSSTFEVTVKAEINGYSRYFVSIVARNSPRDCPMLTFSWKE